MASRLSRFVRAWNRTRRTSGALVALAAAAALGQPAAAQDAPFFGEGEIRLGDGLASKFDGPGRVHHFSFFAPKGSTLNANLAPAQGSALKPVLRLLRPGGYEVPLGSTKRKNGAKTAIQKFKLPYSGWFVLEVAPGSGAGAGAYTLTTSGKIATKFEGVVTAAVPGDLEYQFYAVRGAEVVVKASPRGSSGAKPQLRSIRDRDGRVLWPTPGQTTEPTKAEFVLLPENGTYLLLWTNAGKKGDVKFQFTFTNPQPANFSYLLPASVGTPSDVVDGGEPSLPPKAGYVGSGMCGRCHDEVFRGWSQSVHNLAARAWDRPGITGRAFVNDVNRNGVSDFEDGLDLATQPAFESYGANAPKLSYAVGAELPYKISIGAVTYDVARVMGGSGQWKQRYLVRVGTHLYPSPVQFNEVAGQYATYDAGDWYTGTTPKWADPAQVPHAQSFEARCSGCHNTGLDLQYTGGANGDFQVGHADFNIGCEQCHGPGGEHVKQGDVTKIENPRDLHDGTAEGVARADQVCGRCHTRGTAKDAYPGVTDPAFQKAGFGFTVAGGVPKYGDTLRDYFDVTTKATDYWGQTPRILFTDPDPSKTEYDDFSWVASKSHQQQSLDMETGSHAPHASYIPSCFDCHDPHFRTSKHMVRRVVPLLPERGDGEKRALADILPFLVKTEDNSLCLACHARHGPFIPIPLEDVTLLSSGETTFALKDGVIGHMRDIGMPVRYESYDPVGTHVGQCVSCHMPLVQKSALDVTDKAGFTGGGEEHSHRFETINPRVSRALSSPGTKDGPTNSCNVCHPTAAADIVGPIIEQWANDGADADGGFHADRPRSFQNGIANPNRDGGLFCVQCHTTEGFVRIQVEGDRRVDQADSDEILRHAYERMKGIACDACHGKQGDGTFAAGRNPLRMPKDVLCGSCHNNQSVVFVDFQRYGELVKHPTREMVDGTAGAEVSGTYGNSVHSTFTDGCVTCHYNLDAAGVSHSFEPQIATCQQCHAGLSTFDRPSNSDWDGNGQKQGIQTEVTGLLAALQTTLVGTSGGQITFSGSYFEYGGATDHKMTGASDAQKRAAFNWYSVSYEASRGVHNAVRTVQLLQRSIKELDPNAIPGAVLR